MELKISPNRRESNIEVTAQKSNEEPINRVLKLGRKYAFELGQLIQERVVVSLEGIKKILKKLNERRDVADQIYDRLIFFYDLKNNKTCEDGFTKVTSEVLSRLLTHGKVETMTALEVFLELSEILVKKLKLQLPFEVWKELVFTLKKQNVDLEKLKNLNLLELSKYSPIDQKARFDEIDCYVIGHFISQRTFCKLSDIEIAIKWLNWWAQFLPTDLPKQTWKLLIWASMLANEPKYRNNKDYIQRLNWKIINTQSEPLFEIEDNYANEVAVMRKKGVIQLPKFMEFEFTKLTSQILGQLILEGSILTFDGIRKVLHQRGELILIREGDEMPAYQAEEGEYTQISKLIENAQFQKPPQLADENKAPSLTNELCKLVQQHIAKEQEHKIAAELRELMAQNK